MASRLLLLAFVLIFSNISQSFAEEKFKVGVIAPLTGPLAEYGLAAKNGIELAQTTRPESFSNRVE
jgi:ABC-type branched-subunit amino acid transport system substrate-binding protein